jgi:hypothetical protein
MHKNVNDLWYSGDQQEWFHALKCYQYLVPRNNIKLDQSLDSPDLKQRVRQLDAQGWYAFLHDEYFRWKYTAANRYASTTKCLREKCSLEISARATRRGRDPATMSIDELHDIKKRLLQFNTDDIMEGLRIARKIPGLGTAGASGLLALLYPQRFATVDQFVVKALREVSGLTEAYDIAKMNPEYLSLRDGVMLIKIMRHKAEENNRLFNTGDWTPRKIDKVLWACRMLRNHNMPAATCRA